MSLKRYNDSSARVSELFTVAGNTTFKCPAGSGDQKAIMIQSDILANAGTSSAVVHYIRIPMGLKAKIWSKSLSTLDASTTVSVMRIPDTTITMTTSGFPAAVVMESESLISTSGITLSVEKRRPLTIRGITGKEGVMFCHTGGTVVSGTQVSYEIEITNDIN